MTISKFEVFMKVASVGNISHVADLIGYTQSGVSHIIKNMEDEYGFALFDRTNSGVRLTENGQRMLPIIRAILNYSNILDEYVASVNNMEIGSLRIGAMDSVSTEWLPSIISLFLKKHPKFQISLHNYESPQISTALQDFSIDVGFLSTPPPKGSDSIALREDPLLVVLPESHPLTAYERITPSQLNEEYFVGIESTHYIEQAFQHDDIHPNIRFTASTNVAVTAMVEKGLGISVLPGLRLESIQKGIVTRPLDPSRSRTIYLARPPFVRSSPLVAEFLSITLEWLTEHYSGDVLFGEDA